jgi:putative endonuclease
MQEVGGSIPPGSTSLRLLRKLRLGKPRAGLSSRSKRRLPRRSPKGEDGSQKHMKYVYILESHDSEHFYVGITDDLRARLAKHSAGEVTHTSKYGPWQLKTYVASSDEKQAVEFERYLKSASGRAFAKKHLCCLRPSATSSPHFASNAHND